MDAQYATRRGQAEFVENVERYDAELAQTSQNGPCLECDQKGCEPIKTYEYTRPGHENGKDFRLAILIKVYTERIHANIRILVINFMQMYRIDNTCSFLTIITNREVVDENIADTLYILGEENYTKISKVYLNSYLQ